MARLPDEAWATVGTVSAGNLSNTFGSTTFASRVYLKCAGVSAVKWQLSAVTLGTAAKVYVTPKFRDSAGVITHPYQQDGTPVKWALTDVNRETPPFPTSGAYEVSAELWTDVAAGATGAATVQASRAKE